jgi:DNA-binding transcriptional ArsR family regulator
MTYQVEVEFGTAYELAISFTTFTARKPPKSLELGKAWADEVARSLPAEAAKSLSDLGQTPELDALVHLCPHGRDADAFLAWLGGMSPEEFHETAAGMCLDPQTQPEDFRPVLAPLVEALGIWERYYFRTVDPALLAGLASDAETLRGLMPMTPPADLVELATGGIDLAPAPGLERVVLVPQHHFRPINLYMHLSGWSLFAYPADMQPPEPGAPPLSLTRLTGALADTSRLRLLRLLAARSCTFTEVQKEMGLAKSTIHHHLVILRAAGLIRVHDLREQGTRYSLRPAALDLLGARLSAYLRER